MGSSFQQAVEVPESLKESAMPPNHPATMQNTEATTSQNMEISLDVNATSERIRRASPESSKRGVSEHYEDRASKRVKSSTPSGCTSSTKAPSESGEVKDVITKETWQGFCEIESEPAFFSAILKDMGVEGINVREIFSVLPEYLETLSKPIYGFILLYNYRNQGTSEIPKETHNHVWFANQLPAQNSCATLAMINILMNCADIEIGDYLRQFLDFTKDMTPYQRGEALASFDFVKKIHNSFAKRMDILEADKHLSYKVKKSQHLAKDKKGRRKSTDSAATDDSAEDYEENGHHYIAYVPVGNEVWMLDGLNAQPINIATFSPTRGEDWVSAVVDSIQAIFASGGDNYTVFAIMPSPLPSLRRQACLAHNHLQTTETTLDRNNPEWRSFITDTNANESSVHPAVLGIETELAAHPTPSPLAATIASESTHHLLDRRVRVLEDLTSLANNIMSEMQDEADGARKAEQARFDHGPVIKAWAEMLAGNGYLEQHLDRFMEGKGGAKKARR